jgi:hypothetical protein
MSDPAKRLATIRRAIEAFRATPGRVGSIVSLDSAETVAVVGDLHGHLETLAQVLREVALDKNPTRHLVLQELVHDNRVNPDEGGVDLSHRLVDVACALKCQYPDRVHVIIGNHELSELTRRSISKNGVQLNALFREGVERSYGPMADTIHRAYLDLFRALPAAVRTPNRVMACHTIPDARYLDDFDVEVLRSGEWTPESLARGGAIYAMTWGRDTQPETADRFAALVDADLFVTGHQPCDEGFQKANHRQLIVDGTNPYPAYCLYHAKEPATIERLLDGVRLVAMPD